MLKSSLKFFQAYIIVKKTQIRQKKDSNCKTEGIKKI